MSISSVGSSMSSQMYQVPSQKSGGQMVQQAQPAPTQGPSEENKESASVHRSEAAQGGEARESGLINTYA